MSIVKNNSGYKLSQIEQVDSGETLNDDSLFLVSEVDDDGNYASRAMSYRNLAASLKTTLKLDDDSNNNAKPGLDYPIAQQVFFPNQPLTVLTSNPNTIALTGLYFCENGMITVPDTGSKQAVNVYCIFKAASKKTTGSDAFAPGCGIFVKQKDTNNVGLDVPIKDEQRDNAGTINCIASFMATAGTQFGGYVYNPTGNAATLCAFIQAPMNPNDYSGEEAGADYKIYFNSSNLLSSQVNNTLTSQAGWFQLRSSLACKSNSTIRVEASKEATSPSWHTVASFSVGTNAGKGSGSSARRIHPSVFIPAGSNFQWRMVSSNDVDLSKNVTGKEKGTLYLIRPDAQPATPSIASPTSGIAIKQKGVVGDILMSDTWNFTMSQVGKMNTWWDREDSIMANVVEQFNYTTTTKHDGQYRTNEKNEHVFHHWQPGDTSEHLTYFNGDGGASIASFVVAVNRNKLTELTCYSPTSLAANCLSGAANLKRIYSSTGKIANLANNCAKDCTSLSSVELTCASQLGLKSQCFMGDTALKSLKIYSSGSVQNAWGNAFVKNCTSLTSVSLPPFASKVGDQTKTEAPFYNCSSLQRLTIDATNSGYLGGYVAVACPALTSFTLNGGCKVLSGAQAFDATTKASLKELNLNLAVAGNLEGNIAKSCAELTSITINNGKIGTTGMFSANPKLQKIVLKGSTTFASQAFNNCGTGTTAQLSVDLTNIPTSQITKTFFKSKCFGTSTKNITIMFPSLTSSFTRTSIADALRGQNASNSIIWRDKGAKDETVTRKAVIVTKDSGTTGGFASVGDFTFTNKNGTCNQSVSW